MTHDAVHPDLAAPLKRTRVRLPLPLVRFAVRHLPVPRSDAVQVRAVRRDGVDLRLYEPVGRRTGAGLLWVHGGGLMFGDARQDEALCLSTAERLGLTIVSANYRFAPEHPFPAAHHDVHAAWQWFGSQAERLGVDPLRIAVGGSSAGGGLAAGLVQRLHDDGSRPAAQWLFAPMIDDRTAARRELDATPYPVWDNTKNRRGWGGFLGGPPGTLTPPSYAVPARRDDLTGLPPAFVTWCHGELFADEDARYSDALAAAGVQVTTDVVHGGAHGFEGWAHDTPLARALVTRAQDWLAGPLGVAVEQGV
jgi:acetyl esterase/lipase